MATPEYRYVAVDLLTRTVVEDLPLYGVSLSRQIGGAGNMTGSFKLGTHEYDDQQLLSASQPGLRALFALRNQQCVWAGPIWSRTYDSDAQVIELTGQTYESVFAKMKILNRFDSSTLANQDQLTVFKALIDAMQAQQNSNFGIDTSQIGSSGVLLATPLVVETYDEKMYSDPISALLKQAGSFDYIIDYSFDPTTNNIAIWVKVGYPQLGWQQPDIDIDFPGGISNYYYSESASTGAVRQTVTGSGSGSSQLSAEWVNQTLINAGYPAWADIQSLNQLQDQTLVNNTAQAVGTVNAIPVVSPTINVKIGDDPGGLGGYIDDFLQWSNFGVPVKWHIQDVRFGPTSGFPSGADLSHRMLGWMLTPPSADSVEMLGIQVTGQAAA